MSNDTHPKQRPGVLYGVMALLLAGIGIALYLIQHKLRISLDPDYLSSCNISETVNCDKVNTSEYSEMFGLPIALFAIPTYVMLLAMGAVALASQHKDAAKYHAATSLMALVGVLTTLHSLFLFYVSTAKVGAVCLYCMGLYVVNIGTLVGAIFAGAGGPGRFIGGAFGGLGKTLPVAAVALLVGFGAGYGGYSGLQGSMEASYKKRIDAQLAEDVKPAGDKDGAAAAAAPNNAPKKAAVAAQNPNVPPNEAKRGGKRSPDAWSYFETPLDPAKEFWYGNPDAKVTLVKFADFECGYCKRLSLNLKAIKTKYKDKVRFVMKNFPMNFECNKSMRNFDKHKHACTAAYASMCAGDQGKFWEMHDEMYANQKKLDRSSVDAYAEKVGLDMGKFGPCMSDPSTKTRVEHEVAVGLRAGLRGTPATYINNRLVQGSASRSILEYYIERALADAPMENAEPQAAGPKPDGTTMVGVTMDKKVFYMDPFEAAIDKDGKAVSIPGVPPAQVSWHDAKAACEAAGKRMCSQQEWITACSGSMPEDKNGNGHFHDEPLMGNLFPYGPFYDKGSCRDAEDKKTGRPASTGVYEKCRSKFGVYDLTGNIAEWVEADKAKATLMGGHASSQSGAACNSKTFTTRVGNRNHTTGFRCCADRNVRRSKTDGAALAENKTDYKESPVPEFSAKTTDGKTVGNKQLKGKVTLINFFASWCGPCKKEFPYLVDYQKSFGKKGLQIWAIGVDTLAKKSEDFAKKYEANFPIVTDTEAEVMGKFAVYNMPATFIVDRKGVIRYTSVGFKPAEDAERLKQAIADLL